MFVCKKVAVKRNLFFIPPFLFMQTNKTNMTTLHEAQELARNLMVQHGVGHWRFEWNNAKRALGKCSESRRTIYLSAVMTQLRPLHRVKNTILHEIAHALVGVRHGHDRVWQMKAIEIGCDGERVSNDNVAVQAKYMAECDCGQVHKAHRKPKREHWCKCKGRAFDPTQILQYVQQY